MTIQLQPGSAPVARQISDAVLSVIPEYGEVTVVILSANTITLSTSCASLMHCCWDAFEHATTHPTP